MHIGVIGSGAMGTGIAQVFATAGHQVSLYDNNPKALEKSEKSLKNLFHKLIEKGRISLEEAEKVLKRIAYIDNLAACHSCELILEAIVENLQIKQSVFREIERVVSEDCILATNTSSLSVTSIGAACSLPERFLGLHFFNPAPLMALVEVVPSIQTNEKVLEKAVKLMSSCRKVPVIAKDTPGFIVNRVARPFYGEALRILEEGQATVATIDWAMTDLGGFRMGPFTLMDYIGNDVNYTVTETVFRAFYYDPRYKPSFTQKRLSEAGFLGRKAGRGYYDYREGAQNPEPDKNLEKGRKIFNRILAMLINEAADAVFWGIGSAEDIDNAMVKGVNYPKGLLQWADETGIQQCVEWMDNLYSEYREDRYRCSPLLRKMAAQNKSFFGK